MRTDSLAGVAVFSVSTSVSPESSFKEVQPSMKDAIPLTMRSPLKRSTLSRAPIILCQHLSHVLLVLTEEEKALRDQLFATYRALLDKHQLLHKVHANMFLACTNAPHLVWVKGDNVLLNR